MSTMKAIVIESAGHAVVKEVKQPDLRPNYIKVKVLAVALNPTDWKHIDGIGPPGAVVGCDFAGTIVEIGSQVQTKVSVGDRIAGFTHGSNTSNHESGCFAEYCVVKDGLFVVIPQNISVPAASTLGVGVITCGQGLYQSLELPLPNQPASKPFPVLIYGGSSATGMLAIQFAKASGLTVVATASKRNFELLKGFGADEVFDYSDPDCGAKIREYTKDELYYVMDCITEGDSAKICAEAFASKAPEQGLHYSGLLGVKSFPRDDVKFRSTMGYTAEGEAFEKRGNKVPAKPDHYEFAKKFMVVFGELLKEGKVRPANYKVDEDKGLQGVLDGLQDLKGGKVSGTKFVYQIATQ